MNESPVTKEIKELIAVLPSVERQQCEEFAARMRHTVTVLGRAGMLAVVLVGSELADSEE